MSMSDEVDKIFISAGEPLCRWKVEATSRLSNLMGVPGTLRPASAAIAFVSKLKPAEKGVDDLLAATAKAFNVPAETVKAIVDHHLMQWCR